MSNKNKLVLIDGNSVAYRAFFALHSQLERMKNKNGLHTNALYGFHNMIDSVLTKEKPTHALVAFDAGNTTFRHAFLMITKLVDLRRQVNFPNKCLT